MIARVGAAVLTAMVACRPADPASAVPPTATPPIAPVTPACRTSDPIAIAACVDEARYAQDLRFVAAARPPGSPQHLRVQLRCAEVFEQWGYTVEMHDYGTGTNVVGRRGDAERPTVLLGAHYDHVPGCPGADDNASGVAAVLELARALAGVPATRPLAFACWDEEEWGLVGSRAWAMRARERGEAIAVYFNFDAIAFTDPRPDTQRVPTGLGLLFPGERQRLAEHDHRADFIALVADPAAGDHARRLAHHGEGIDLRSSVLVVPSLVKDSKIAFDLQRSDHASFWDAGYPAVMITDTADFRSDAYHCKGRPDELETLDLPFAGKVVRATAAAVTEALVLAPDVAP